MGIAGRRKVTMGAFDGVKLCKLVGCFILNKPQVRSQKKRNVGLHRDISGPQSEKIKKISTNDVLCTLTAILCWTKRRNADKETEENRHQCTQQLKQHDASYLQHRKT